MKAQIDHDIATDKELAELMNVNASQLWRCKLPINDERHNAPGNQFIAGVMKVFGGNFNDYFFIEEVEESEKKTRKKQTA